MKSWEMPMSTFWQVMPYKFNDLDWYCPTIADMLAYHNDLWC